MKSRFVFGLLLLPLFLSSCGNDPIPEPSYIKFSEDAVFLKEGERKNLSVLSNIQGFDASKLVFAFDRTKIAYEEFVVSGLTSGHTNIVAKYEDLTANCLVFVQDNLTSYSISEDEIVLEKEESKKLYVLKDGNRYDNVYWHSSDASIATVGDDGEVVGHKPGKASIDAYVHGSTYSCIVNVFGVDGCLDDWYLDGEPRYFEECLNDVFHPERGYTVFATARTDGLYFGGYCAHAQINEGATYWYGESNFEVFVDMNGKATQYYATENFYCPGAETSFKTSLNPNSISDYDAYLSVFEIHIKQDLPEACGRANFAFKTEGETMSWYVGGAQKTLNTSDWWWIDLHYPGNTNEYFIITEEGFLVYE